MVALHTVTCAGKLKRNDFKIAQKEWKGADDNRNLANAVCQCDSFCHYFISLLHLFSCSRIYLTSCYVKVILLRFEESGIHNSLKQNPLYIHIFLPVFLFNVWSCFGLREQSHSCYLHTRTHTHSDKHVNSQRPTDTAMNRQLTLPPTHKRGHVSVNLRHLFWLF